MLVLAYALSGYWQGFVTGAFATAGLLLGGLFGVWLAPVALGDADPSLLVSLGALFIVILAASLGQGLLQWAGAKIRDRITWQPVRALDAVGGAALSAAAVLIVAWALGVAVSGSRIDGVTPMVRSSVVLAKVNQVLPQRAGGVLDAFNTVVGTSFFPRYLEPFSPERIVEVKPGDRRMLRDPDVTRAGGSVLKVRGTNDCGRGVEGSGFVYAEDRLMTNAHVVAGVDDPQVVRRRRRRRRRAGGLLRPRPRHRRARVRQRGDPGAAVHRPRTTRPSPRSRSRSSATRRTAPSTSSPAGSGPTQALRSPDIYGDGAVIRDVYSLRGLVRPGNSGGPIVDSEGQVVGRGVRGLGHRRRHRLRAHRRPGPRRRRPGRTSGAEQSTAGVCAARGRGCHSPLCEALAQQYAARRGSALPAQRLRDLPALLDRLLRRADLLELLDADEGQQRRPAGTRSR